MDDVTFVYYEGLEKPSPLSIALIQNETKSNLVKVTDAELADKLDLKPGKFYCYYKPSFANYDPELAMRPAYLSNEEFTMPMQHRYPTIVD